VELTPSPVNVSSGVDGSSREVATPLPYEPSPWFPPADCVRTILVLRTAPLEQVRLAIEELRQRYPDVRFAVLGTGLDHGLFDGMEKFAIRERWVTPRSYAPLRRQVELHPFDLAVVCLNSDHVVGYGRVSQVMRRIPARVKLGAGYTGRWFEWGHPDFSEVPLVFRWAINASLVLLYPLVAIYLLLRPARPVYPPRDRWRSAPRYEP
jgi:hypothetical protein